MNIKKASTQSNVKDAQTLKSSKRPQTKHATLSHKSSQSPWRDLLMSR